MRYLLFTARPILEDLGGTLAFYLLYLATGSVALAASIGLALGLGQMALHLWRRQRVPALLAIGVALTAGLGGLAMLTGNSWIVLAKPSILYACIGAAMLPRGWVVRYVPPIGRELLPAVTLDRVGWAWAALMFATAALNLALLATIPPRAAAGVFVVCAMTSKLLLFAGQYTALKRRAKRRYHARQAHPGPVVRAEDPTPGIALSRRTS